jgi:hypothetical protein
VVDAQVNHPQDILFGVASQTLFFDAPEGRPSAATVAVYEDSQGSTGTAEAATTGDVSVDSYSTTFSAASGDGEVDPTELNLTTVTGMNRGQVYLVISITTGHREMVEISHIDTVNVKAYAKTPLLNAYATNDTVQSVRMSVTVDTTWASDVSNLSDPLCPSQRHRVEWSYTADSTPRRAAGWFDLIRLSTVHSVTPPDVDGRFPGWLDRLPTDDRIGQGERLIRQAFREVGFDLLEHGLADYAQRNGPVINELVIYKSRVLSAEANFDHAGTSEAQLARAEKAYERRLNLLRPAPKTNQQVTADGAGGRVSPTPLMAR